MDTEKRVAEAEIFTSNFRVVGHVVLSSESYRGRLSDRLNHPKHPFLPVTEARLWSRDGGSQAEPRELDCVILNTADIEAILPLVEPETKEIQADFNWQQTTQA